MVPGPRLVGGSLALGRHEGLSSAAQEPDVHDGRRAGRPPISPFHLSGVVRACRAGSRSFGRRPASFSRGLQVMPRTTTTEEIGQRHCRWLGEARHTPVKPGSALRLSSPSMMVKVNRQQRVMNRLRMISQQTPGRFRRSHAGHVRRRCRFQNTVGDHPAQVPTRAAGVVSNEAPGSPESGGAQAFNTARRYVMHRCPVPRTP